MDIILFILLIVVTGAIVVVSGLMPPVPTKSRFELQRLAEGGDEWARRRLKRLRYWKEILSLLRLIYSILLLVAAFLSLLLFGWLGGIAASIAVILISGLVARTPLADKQTRRLYRRWEMKLVAFIQHYQKVVWWLRVPAPELAVPNLHSKDELEHQVEMSTGVFTPEEKALLLHGIRFTEKQAKDFMTKRSRIESVKKSEILGPLTLDSLHKAGHSCYPVTQGDLDHIVGILYLADVLTIDTSRKHTALVETAMDKRVLYIHETRPLMEALSILLEAHRHVLVVVDDEGKTVGLLTLGDIVNAIFGYRPTHELHDHDDRSVAASHR